MGLKETAFSFSGKIHGALDGLRYQKPISVGSAVVDRVFGLHQGKGGINLQVITLDYTGADQRGMGCTFSVPEGSVMKGDRVEVIVQLHRGFEGLPDGKGHYRRAVRPYDSSNYGKVGQLDAPTIKVLRNNDSFLQHDRDFVGNFLGVRKLG